MTEYRIHVESKEDARSMVYRTMREESAAVRHYVHQRRDTLRADDLIHVHAFEGTHRVSIRTYRVNLEPMRLHGTEDEDG